MAADIARTIREDSASSQGVSCRCKRQREPCANMPTAEDLLCDHCRPGCSLAVSGGTSAHLNNTAEVDCTARLQVLYREDGTDGG